MDKKRMVMLAGAYSAAAMAAVLSEAANTRPGERIIENRGQAMPKGALRTVQGSRTDRRSLKREAALELMDMSRKTVVVAHLHPRWLRQLVEAAMDSGQHVTNTDVERWRAQGKTLALIGLRLIKEEALG